MIRKQPPPFVPMLKDLYDTQYFVTYPDSAVVDKKMQERVKDMTEFKRCAVQEEKDMFDNF